MQYLFDSWEELSRSLKAADHILFLSDFDGTLTPIVDRPELAVLSRETAGLLRRLVKDRRYTVGIISGRALADLKERVDVDGIIYSGNHGLEIEGLGTSFLEPIAEEVRPFFQLLSQVLTTTLKGIKGVFVENKGLTLSVHYRSVTDAEQHLVRDRFSEVIDPLQVIGRVRITRGKKVFEIRPPINWDKGKAVSLLIAKLKEAKKKVELLPLYLGDDLTDEDAFKVVKAHNGISILIGEEYTKSEAHYFLSSPDEVVELLKIL
jgi:trehalose 6-phosphate phosphatase